MLTFFKRLLGLAPAQVNTQEIKTVVVAPAPQRAKDAQGRFQADDPATPENEAWVGGVAPAKTSAKVSAITDSGSEAVKSASANKRRRSNRNNKVKAGTTATKTTNSHVKPAQVAKSKPAKSKAPAVKK